MSHEFRDRFTSLTDTPISLQLVLPSDQWPDLETLREVVQNFAVELADAQVEWYCLDDAPEWSDLVPLNGPRVSYVGLIQFHQHTVKLIACDGPMPEGPFRACVEPALMSPEDKELAAEHQAHLLLYEFSDAPRLDRWAALASIAGVWACLGATTVLNEEARCAAPAVDLIPEEDEDIFATLRELPIPYLYGGFVRLDIGQANYQWVRTFNNHTLQLPELAMRVTNREELQDCFNLFAGILGYLYTMEEELIEDDSADLGEHGKFRFRKALPEEWFLESDTVLFVLERLSG